MKKRGRRKLLCLALVCCLLWTSFSRVGSAETSDTYRYEETFDYLQMAGTPYFPESWSSVENSERPGSGRLTIQKENDRIYYSIDETESGPKYLGLVWGEESPTLTTMEFDFRLGQTEFKDIALMMYERKLNAGNLAIRGAITSSGDVVLYNGSEKMTLENIAEDGWVHFRYDIDNGNKNFTLTITNADTGEEVAKAENYGFFNESAEYAGAFAFGIEDSVQIDVDDFMVYDTNAGEEIPETTEETQPEETEAEETEPEETYPEETEPETEFPEEDDEEPEGEYTIFYQQNFDEEDQVGEVYSPYGWSTAGSIGDGVGNMTIKEEDGRYYYSMDMRNGCPKYLGKVLAGLSKQASIQYDLRVKQLSSSKDIGLVFYDSGINGKNMGIRGGISNTGDVFFYNGTSKTAIGTINGAEWMHITYAFDNENCTYTVSITDMHGNIIAQTPSDFAYYSAAGQVGAFAFCVEESAWIDVDSILVDGYKTPFVFSAEIDPLEQTGMVSLSESEDGTCYILKNDACMVVINRSTANIEQYYTKEGYEICGSNGNGYYLLNYTDSEFTGTGKQETAFKGGVGSVIRQSDELVEISVKAEELAGLPIDMDFRFVMTSDTPGLYMYAMVNQSENADPDREFAIGQSRYSIKFDYEEFPYSSVGNGDLIDIAGPGDFAEMDPLFDSTYVLNDGSIYSKYKNLEYQFESYFCGAYGNQGGLSLITASRDWAGGGYTKQDIDVHGGTGNTFIVNWHLSTGHNGTAEVDIQDGYEKLFGPVLWYANTSVSSKEEAKEDAWRQTQEEMEKWPYAWMEEEQYAADSRSTLKGKFSVTNGTIDPTVKNDITVEGAVGWAVLSDARSDYWALDNGYYEFYAPVYADGSFEITNIIPGTYKLNINVNGIMDEYQLDNVVIGESETIDLGNVVWDDPIYGETLWTIGIPDKTAEEYAYGTPYRYWGAHVLFNTLFPNGVDYKIGESDYSTDWFFMHPASQTIGHKEQYDGSLYYDEELGEIKYDASRAVPLTEDDARWRGNELAEYKIRFDCDSAYENGTGTLLINVCGNRFGTLSVTLNGQSITDTITFHTGGSVGRCGIVDINQLVKLEFDANLLQEGENVITLTHEHPVYEADNETPWEDSDYTIYSGIMYDAIRLDVDGEKAAVDEPETDPSQGETESSAEETEPSQEETEPSVEETEPSQEETNPSVEETGESLPDQDAGLTGDGNFDIIILLVVVLLAAGSTAVIVLRTLRKKA